MGMMNHVVLLFVAMVALLVMEAANGERTFKVYVREIPQRKRDINKPGALPGMLNVELQGLGGDVILRLKRNYDVNHNAPVTFTDGSTIADGSALQNVAVYQDFSKRASISVSAHISNHRHVRSLEGSFVYKDIHYLIEPVTGFRAFLQKRDLHDVDGVPHVVTERKFEIPRSTGRRKKTRRKKTRQRKPHGNKVKKTYTMKAPTYENLSRREISRENIILKPKKIENPHVTKKVSRRATTPKRYTVEVLLLLDHTIWERNMELAKNNEVEALKKLKYYFSHMINGMDLAYSSIDGAENGFTIDIFLKGYEIAKTKKKKVPTVPFLMGDTSGTEYRNIRVNSNSVLENLRKWHTSGDRTWYNPDHAMLFTRYDTYDAIYKNAVIGMSPNRGICTASGNSLLEDLGFNSWFTGAHELGHNLGAGHDGQFPNHECSGSKRNVMTPSGGYVESENMHNIYTFSSCSITAMKSALEGNIKYRRYPRVCLQNRVCDHVDFSPEVGTLPGVKYSAEEQCQIRFGLDSAICYRNGEAQCVTMYCKDQLNRCSGWSPGAADGTPCATNKWCIHGQCVPKTSETSGGTTACVTTPLAVPPPSGCIDGNIRFSITQPDGSQVILTCGGVANKFPEYCYTQPSITTKCCASCHKLGLVS